MSKLVEQNRIVWRSKKARGPDVEMVFFMPVSIAIESKHTVADALDKASQVIGYVQSKRYDAVFLRLENPPEKENRDLKSLKDIIGKYGIGIIIGGDPYSPLTGSEKVLQKASLNLCSNPSELLRDMSFSSQILSMPKETSANSSSLRKYFVVCGHEC